MNGYCGQIERIVSTNNCFRKVLFTGTHTQLVIMSLQAGEEIGEKTHDNVDQFFRIERGAARFVFDGNEEQLLNAGDAVLVPMGTRHNVINASKASRLKLYTIYSPPNHPDGTVHETKAKAEAAEPVQA